MSPYISFGILGAIGIIALIAGIILFATDDEYESHYIPGVILIGAGIFFVAASFLIVLFYELL